MKSAILAAKLSNHVCRGIAKFCKIYRNKFLSLVYCLVVDDLNKDPNLVRQALLPACINSLARARSRGRNCPPFAWAMSDVGKFESRILRHLLHGHHSMGAFRNDVIILGGEGVWKR